MPDLPTNKTTFEDYAQTTGDFTFKDADLMAFKVYVTPKTGMLSDEGQGEIDGKSFSTKGSFFHPGAGAKAKGMFSYLNNTSAVLVVPASDGQLYIVGSIEHPVKFSPKWDSGQDPADRRGFTCEYESYSPYGALLFSGTKADFYSESSSSSSASA